MTGDAGTGRTQNGVAKGNRTVTYETRHCDMSFATSQSKWKEEITAKARQQIYIYIYIGEIKAHWPSKQEMWTYILGGCSLFSKIYLYFDVHGEEALSNSILVYDFSSLFSFAIFAE